MATIQAHMKRHPATSFFLLAYAITWSSWFPISYGYHEGWLELTPLVTMLYIAGSFGPLLAAAIVTYLTGRSLRAWFVQALKWRVSVKWWVAALLIPVLFYALMAAIHVTLGGRLDWSEMSPLLAVPGVYLTIFLWGGGNEELGWRGFALPHLQQRYSPLVASLIIGIIWTVWHAPPGIVELGFSGWAADLPYYMVSVTSISIVATWLYNNSGGSVLLTMLFHAGINGAQSLYPVQGMFEPTGEVARMAAWIVLVLAVVFLMRWERVPISEDRLAGWLTNRLRSGHEA